MQDVKTEVRGIRELSGALRKIDSESQKKLKESFKGIAESVASSVRTKVPKRKGRAAASIVARGSTRGASIAFGGQKAPYMPWLDFGGSVGRGHRSGVPWSGAIKRDWLGNPTGMGRYVYPTIKEHGREIKEETDKALKKAIKSAGFETKD